MKRCVEGSVVAILILSGLIGIIIPAISAPISSEDQLREVVQSALHIANSRRDPRAMELDVLQHRGAALFCEESEKTNSCTDPMREQLIAELQTEFGVGNIRQTQQQVLACGSEVVYVAYFDTQTRKSVELRGSLGRAILTQDPSGDYTSSSGMLKTAHDKIRLVWPGHPGFVSCRPVNLTTDPQNSAFRLATIDAICSLLQAHFFDPAMRGLDWRTECATVRTKAQSPDIDDERFWKLAANLPTKLDTSHTAYYPAHDPTLALLYSVFGGTDNLKTAASTRGGLPEMRGTGIFATDVDGRAFIEHVLPGSPAEKAGIKEGDELVSSGVALFSAYWPDQKATDKTMETTIQIRRQAGAPIESITLPLMSDDGLRLLGKATEASVRLIEHDGIKIGYLRGWSMLTRDHSGGPAFSMQEAVHGLFADANAVILDARGRVGGGGLDVLMALRMPRFIQSRKSRANEHWIDMRTMPKNLPLIIIVSQHTRSAAEIMAYLAKRQDLALLVGSRTAGAVAGGTLFPLPDGGGLYIAVSALRLNGEILEGRGVTPDIVVQRHLPYANGADEQLERAIEEAAKLAKSAR